MTAIATVATAPAPVQPAAHRAAVSGRAEGFDGEYAAASRAQGDSRGRTDDAHPRVRSDAGSKGAARRADTSRTDDDRSVPPQTSAAPGSSESGTEPQVSAATTPVTAPTDASASDPATHVNDAALRVLSPEGAAATGEGVNGTTQVTNPDGGQTTLATGAEPAVMTEGDGTKDAPQVSTSSAIAPGAGEAGEGVVAASTQVTPSQTQVTAGDDQAVNASATGATGGIAPGGITPSTSGTGIDSAAAAGGAAAAPSSPLVAGNPTPNSVQAAGGALQVPAGLSPVRDQHSMAPATPENAAATLAAAPATPTQAPVSSPAAPAPAPALATPLAQQLTGQLTSIRTLPQGDHVLTLTVNPETFGPVKVVAHIGADGVRLELFGASEQARAALKTALPDLRRDLVGAGLEPRIDVGNGSSSDARERSAMGNPDGSGHQAGRPPSGGTRGVAQPAPAPPPLPTDHSHAAGRGRIDLSL